MLLRAHISREQVRSWGWKAAHALFQDQHIISSYNFDLIFWEGPKLGIHVFLTKMGTGTNKEPVENICPCCDHPDESTSHTTCCLDHGRQRMLHESVDTNGEGSMLSITVIPPSAVP